MCMGGVDILDRLNDIFNEITLIKHQIKNLERKETALSREAVNIILTEGGIVVEDCAYGLEYITPDNEFKCEICIDVLKKNSKDNYAYAGCSCNECKGK